MANNPSPPTASTRLRNTLIALAAICLSIALFFGLGTKTGSASLQAQAEKSLSLDAALSNGKPTLVEFYADWCTSCQTMAGDLDAIKQQYAKDLNFVMLNVDNTKWLPEMLHYRVDGIPHFVFLDNQGEEVAQAIGEQPNSVIRADLDALVANLPLPYTYTAGQLSQLNSQVVAPHSTDDPRAHSSQVQ